MVETKEEKINTFINQEKISTENASVLMESMGSKSDMIT